MWYILWSYSPQNKLYDTTSLVSLWYISWYYSPNKYDTCYDTTSLLSLWYIWWYYLPKKYDKLYDTTSLLRPRNTSLYYLLMILLAKTYGKILWYYFSGKLMIHFMILLAQQNYDKFYDTTSLASLWYISWCYSPKNLNFMMLLPFKSMIHFMILLAANMRHFTILFATDFMIFYDTTSLSIVWYILWCLLAR